MSTSGIPRHRLVAVSQPDAEQRFQTLVEQIPAIVYIDRPQEDETLYVSPQIEQILGITAAEYREDPDDRWVAMLHPDDRERVLAQYEVFLRGEGGDLDDYRMIRADGSIVWIRDRAHVVRDEQGRVLIEQGLMFDVTELKDAQETAAHRLEQLERAEGIGERFNRIVLQGETLGGIIDVLGELTERTVVLEDAAHQVVEYAIGEGASSEVLSHWEAHSRSDHSNRAGTLDGCTCVPIPLRGEDWGRIHMLSTVDEANVPQIALVALDRAAAAVGLALLSERDAVNVADRTGGALLFDLIEGRYRSLDATLERARGFGADLAHRRLAVVVVEMVPEAADGGPMVDLHPEITTAIRELRRGIGSSGCTGLVASQGDRAIAIVGLPGDWSPAALDAICGHVVDSVGSGDLPLKPAVGISGEASAETLGKAAEQAAEAVAYASRTGGGVRHFGELGMHHLLVKLADGPELALFVESTLKPLLDHDAKRTSPLIPTLRSLLENSGAKTRTARDLNIERRTLYHRLDRIEELTGVDLDDRETRLQLEVALQGLDLLSKRSRT